MHSEVIWLHAWVALMDMLFGISMDLMGFMEGMA